MSRTSSGPLAKLNVPLILLWMASVIVAVAGYVLMTSSNAHQAQLYTSQTGDYAKLFAAQSGSTIGGLLIAVGVLGVLLALAAQVSTRTRTVAPSPTPAAAAVDERDFAFDDQSFSIETVYPATGNHAQPTDGPLAPAATDAPKAAGHARAAAAADAEANQDVHLDTDENRIESEKETVPAR